VGQLGFVVAGGLLVGYGIGYGIDVLAGTKAWRIAGIFLGLAGGLWEAGRVLVRISSEGRGDSHT